VHFHLKLTISTFLSTLSIDLGEKPGVFGTQHDLERNPSTTSTHLTSSHQFSLDGACNATCSKGGLRKVKEKHFEQANKGLFIT
jgi:hypothetical protein